MDKKGFELAISTFVIFIMGLAVLIGLILFLRGGFENLESGTAPFLETAEGTMIKESCELLCISRDKIGYCCKKFDYNESNLSCEDSRLEVECNLDCTEFVCAQP